MKYNFKLVIIFGLLLVSNHVISQIDEDLKIEKRFIHPRSKYLTFSAGWGFTSILVKDPNHFLTEGVLMQNNTYLPQLMYEHGIANNFFGELGYSFIHQGVFYGRKLDVKSFSSYYRFFGNHTIQIGIGYRVITKNNLHFFNIHGGIFAGIANRKINNLPIEYSVDRLDFFTNYKYTTLMRLNDFNSLAFGAYLGISKEIRLSKDVRFFLKGIQLFGMRSILSGTIELSSDEIDFINEPASFEVRSGGFLLTAGLKIQLFK